MLFWHHANLQCLPEDRIPGGLLDVDDADVSNNPKESNEAEDDSSSFLPFPIGKLTEDSAISSTTHDTGPISCPGLRENVN